MSGEGRILPGLVPEYIDHYLSLFIVIYHGGMVSRATGGTGVGRVCRELRVVLSVLCFVILGVIGIITWGLFYAGKHETERIVRQRGALMAMNAEGVRILNEMYSLPPGTEAVATSFVKFALPGGRLVTPYPANTFDMARDGAVEVEHIKVRLDHRDVDGWVVAAELQHVCCPMP